MLPSINDASLGFVAPSLVNRWPGVQGDSEAWYFGMETRLVHAGTAVGSNKQPFKAARRRYP